MKKELAEEILNISLENKKYNWDEVLMLFIKENNIKIKRNPVISVCQNKGGVGKTTTTINLGYLFSKLGKTLLIDMDSQANLSQAFNIYKKANEPTVKDFLENPSLDMIEKLDDNLHLLPNKHVFDLWKKSKGSETRSYKMLKKALKNIKKEFDFILIDCPPSLDIAFDMSITASTHTLIIMDAEPFSLENLENIFSELQRINDDEDELNLKNLGILFNKYKEVNLKFQVYQEAQENYDVFTNKIRDTIQISESQALKQPIFKYNETCNGSLDFFKAWKELLGKL